MTKRLLGTPIVALLIFTALTPISTPAYDTLFNERVLHDYFESFGLQPEKTTKPVIEAKSFAEGFKNFFKILFAPNPFITPNLTDYEQVKFISLISKSNIQHNPENTISYTVVNKTDLVKGSHNGPNFIDQISNIKNKNNKQKCLLETNCGKLYLAKKITQPHTNIKSITKTQSAINAFSQAICYKKELADAIINALKTIGSSEKYLLSYCDVNSIIDIMIMNGQYWNMPMLKRLNNSSSGLQAGVLTSQAILGACLFGLGYKLKKTFAYEAGQSNFYTKTLGVCFYTLLGYSTLAEIKHYKDLYNYLQTHLIGVASHIDGVKKLYKVLNKYPEITNNISNFKALEALVKPSTKHSAEFNELIKLLNTDTFKGDSSIFSLHGRVLRAHKLLSEKSVRDEFASILQAIGEIDVYVALAHQISVSAHKTTRYSLVTFDTTSTKPYIKATGLWNPFVPKDKVVTNNIDLGYNKPRNIILSGPNTGGKSTISKAILLNTILAQTFGIVAAESMTMTPFANLDCYLNLTDDTASGISGLKAEVLRAKELLQKIRETEGFSFVLLDEIFTATSPDQAQKLALNFLTKLCTFKNTMFIDAAHFEGLIQFAENSADCRNCHMGAIVGADGKVSKYTYKLTEGRSHVKNAAQVAEENFSFDD